MRTPVEHIVYHLKNIFNGTPWYGEAVFSSLESINPDFVVQVYQKRSIYRISRHILTWRTFVLKKIQGDEEYDIEMGGPVDWPPEQDMPWDDVLEAIEKTQKDLLEALKTFPNERLLEIVPGRNFNFQYMLDGLIQHDVYHFGQINLLYRLLLIESGIFKDFEDLTP